MRSAALNALFGQHFSVSSRAVIPTFSVKSVFTLIFYIFPFVLKVEFYSQNNQNKKKELKAFKNNVIIGAVE